MAGCPPNFTALFQFFRRGVVCIDNFCPAFIQLSENENLDSIGSGIGPWVLSFSQGAQKTFSRSFKAALSKARGPLENSG